MRKCKGRWGLQVPFRKMPAIVPVGFRDDGTVYVRTDGLVDLGPATKTMAAKA